MRDISYDTHITEKLSTFHANVDTNPNDIIKTYTKLKENH